MRNLFVGVTALLGMATAAPMAEAQTLRMMKSLDAPHYDGARTTWSPSSDIVNMFQDTLVAMDWDGIQHGAQVHWVPEKDHGLSDAQRANMDFKSMPDEVAKVLKEYNAKKKADAKTDCSGLVATEKTISKEPDVVDPKTGQKTPGQTRKMGVIDANVTAVFGEGAVNLKSKNDVVEAMLCKECGE